MGFVIDQEKLPHNWPTHKGDPEFWEELGRTVACFGMLEDTLAKGTAALNLHKLVVGRKASDISKQELDVWAKAAAGSLSDTLNRLISGFKKAMEKYGNPKVDDIVNRLRELTVWRNVLCHASWLKFSDGVGYPEYFTHAEDGSVQRFQSTIALENLEQIRSGVTEAICLVFNCVEATGVAFPGRSNP